MIRPTLLRPLTRATATLTRPVLTTPRSIAAAAAVNTFHTTAPRLIKPGDPLPDTDALMENTPGHRVNLADEAQRVNNMLLIGVPAAFSPACSATHVPGYVNHPRTKEFELVGVVSVNDVFV
jgi:2-Cys peroxiredoxin 5